jgi:hypothetical protein
VFPGRFSVLQPLPVAPVLGIPLLLGRRRRPVALPGLPFRPLPRCLAAFFAAIPLARMPRPEPLRASLQQTAARPWPSADRTFWSARRLLFQMACRILRKAHGRWMLPEAQALERNANPLQATTISGSAILYRRRCPRFFPPFRRGCVEVNSLCNQLFAPWLISLNRGSTRRHQPTTAWPPLAPP